MDVSRGHWLMLALAIFVHTSLIKLYKRLIHRAHDVHMTDDEILRATGLPDPSTLLRMRHFGALYATADSAAWGVLNADTEWVSLICSDLDWMWKQLQGSSDLQDPSLHLASWDIFDVTPQRLLEEAHFESWCSCCCSARQSPRCAVLPPQHPVAAP